MQQLIFHPAWDRTIAKADRELLIETFEQTKLAEEQPVQMTVLKHAVNYKGELLVTGIVHNQSEEPYSPDESIVEYVQKDQLLAKHSFTIPDLVIKAKTSMPWTFIFPENTISQQPEADDPGIVKVF